MDSTQDQVAEDSFPADEGKEAATTEDITKTEQSTTGEVTQAKGGSKKRKAPTSTPKKSSAPRQRKRGNKSEKSSRKPVRKSKNNHAANLPPNTVLKDGVEVVMVEVDDISCTVCNKKTHANKMILCDTCQNGKHLFCFV